MLTGGSNARRLSVSSTHAKASSYQFNSRDGEKVEEGDYGNYSGDFCDWE
jgi:hypothetical protein